MDQMVPVQRFELAIAGMDCASCVSRVERSLARVAGVERVSVNLATETAHLEARAGTSLADLVAAVARAGYSASLRGPDTALRDGWAFWELVAGAGLCAPLLAGMVWAVPGWVELALAAVVQVWLGARFYVGAAAALRAGAGNMDLLVALGTSAAFGLSVVDFARGAGPLYFESGALVIVLVRLGKFLEARAKRQAAKAITGLRGLRPEAAHVPGRGDVALARLAVGDVIEIRPGERVPVDGVITAGLGSLDESHITGEGLAQPRGVGAGLLAGSLNLDAVLRVRVTSQAGESFLDRMARLIDSAQGSKPQMQVLADRVAAWFVPVVVLISAVTLGGWLLAGAPVGRAVIDAVSTLVIACPCALGLATPAAILAGTGAAARRGILIRNADVIEAATKVSLVVFDKTGTLTLGKPALARVQCLGDVPRDAVMEIAGALAASDTHKLSTALGVTHPLRAEMVKSLPGLGVTGRVAGHDYVLGSAALMARHGFVVPEAEGAATWSYLAAPDGGLLAGFAFADQIRPEAAAALARLRASGKKLMMLSGDREAAAQAAGRTLGIDNVVGGASPEAKIAAIRAAQAQGDIVAMVGDGVNDAAALAAADVGIAIGAAADVAIEAADISLLRADLQLVPDALALSRKTWNVLREGLFWAVIYNVIGIPAAAFGLLSPAVAGAAMAASSVCVLANALRLGRGKHKK